MAQNRDGGNPFAEPGELDNPFQVTCGSLPLGIWVDSSRFWTLGLTCIPIRDISGEGPPRGVTMTRPVSSLGVGPAPVRRWYWQCRVKDWGQMLRQQRGPQGAVLRTTVNLEEASVSSPRGTRCHLNPRSLFSGPSCDPAPTQPAVCHA